MNGLRIGRDPSDGFELCLEFSAPILAHDVGGSEFVGDLQLLYGQMQVIATFGTRVWRDNEDGDCSGHECSLQVVG